VFHETDDVGDQAQGPELILLAFAIALAQFAALAVEDDSDPLRHLSPLGWEHINLTGDYVWRQNKRAETGAFRPLRRASDP
jgi:hypothetical protein